MSILGVMVKVQILLEQITNIANDSRLVAYQKSTTTLINRCHEVVELFIRDGNAGHHSLGGLHKIARADRDICFQVSKT